MIDEIYVVKESKYIGTIYIHIFGVKYPFF